MPPSATTANPRSAHCNIILLCLLVTIPMVAFTATILQLVFGYRVDDMQCAHQELCPKNGLNNNIYTVDNYYVDFPAARLAFVASWSSTVSFALIGTFMAIYSYVAASKFMKISALSSGQDSLLQNSLPTTYQTSVLLRILNAELFTLYSSAYHKLKKVFWTKEMDDKHKAQAQIVRFSIVVLSVCLCASLLIQAADTYMHVAIETIEIFQARALPSVDYSYSRGLAPWCLGRPTLGDPQNPNYWSCGLKLNDINHTRIIDAMNCTYVTNVGLGTSPDNSISDFVDTDDTHVALLAPRRIPAGIDYQASTYGLSMQCQYVRNYSCAIQEPEMIRGSSPVANFNCSDPSIGLNLSGTMYPSSVQVHEYDFNRLFQEPRLFIAADDYYVPTQNELYAAANLSDSTVFNNPWRLLAVVNMVAAHSDAWDGLGLDDRGFDISGFPMVMFSCNSTTWNVNYTVVDSKISKITRTPSNSTVAGISSMTMAQTFGYSSLPLQYSQIQANGLAKNVSHFAQLLSQGMARQYLVPIVAQSSPRPALLVQSRSSKIVTKVPKSALWILVIANLLYAILAIILAILALLVTSMDIHQLRTRLSVTGLAAHLFEGEYAERDVKDEKDLFEKGDVSKRVGVRRTEAGGATFSVVKA